MRKTKRPQRWLSLALCLSMLVGALPLSGMAYAAGTGCNHVHDDECGYVETVVGKSCTFVHVHDETCGYAEAVDAVPCMVEAEHIHDAACGFNPDTGEGCTFQHTPHDGECGYAEAVDAVPCSVEAAHSHDDDCGYVEAVAGKSCNHKHDASCGGLTSLGQNGLALAQVNAIPEMDPKAVGFAGEEWWVIGKDGVGVNSQSGTMTLLSKKNLFTTAFDTDESRGSTANNKYDGSVLQKAMENFYNNLSAENKALIVARELDGVRVDDHYDVTLPGDHYVWPLSETEALSLPEAIRANNSTLWLRSAFRNVDFLARVVDEWGDFDTYEVAYVCGGRPALTLKLDSVLFTSAATGDDKSSAVPGSDGLIELTTTDTVKLTVKDDTNLSLDVTDSGPVTAKAGETASFDYTGAATGTGCSVSVLIKDSADDSILYYGRPVDCESGNASGTASFTLPDDLEAGNYTLLAFNEQVNGDNKTDLASTPRELTLQVTSDSTAFYHPDDVAVVKGIIRNSNLGSLGWKQDDPSSWNTTPNDDRVYITWDDSELRRIKELFIFDIGFSGTLDVSGLTILQTLDCSENNLAALDVSGLSALQTLNCFRTNLGELDLTGLSSSLRLNCSDNPIQSLKLPNGDALTVTVSPANSGTVSLQQPPSYYPDSKEVTLQATAKPGYLFNNWSGDANGNGDCILTLEGDKHIIANFDLDSATTLEVAFNDNGMDGSQYFSNMATAVGDALTATGKDKAAFTTIRLTGSAAEITGWNWCYLLELYQGSDWPNLSVLDLSGMTGLDKIENRSGGTYSNISNLTVVQFPESLKTIGNAAFYWCKGLTSVSFPTGLETIGNNAFYSCDKLESAHFPVSLETLGGNAFSGCKKLNSADLSGCQSLKAIGNIAFASCTSLTSVRFPESLETIGGSAFSGCSNLNVVSFLRSTLPSVGENAFSGISSTGVIYYPAASSSFTDDWKNSVSGFSGWTLTATGVIAPAISDQPVDQNINEGATASFFVAATGVPTPSYQWQESTNSGATWTNITEGGIYSGVATGTLTLTKVPLTHNGYRYRCVVGNIVQEVTSTAAILTVTAVYHPNDVAVVNGIIKKSSLGSSGWIEGDPSTWSQTAGSVSYVTWDDSKPKRVKDLVISTSDLSGTLDVTGLSNLEYLSCDNNSLTVLNVSNLSNLRTLSCDNNPIQSLKLPGEEALTVDVSPANSGTVKLTHAGNLLTGKSVTLTAVAKPGNIFRDWSGDASGGDNTLPLTLDRAQSITANFDFDPDAILTVEFNDNAGGGLNLTNNQMASAVENALQSNGKPKTDIAVIQLTGAADKISIWNWRYLLKLYENGSEWTNLRVMDLSSMSGLTMVEDLAFNHPTDLRLTTVRFPDSLQTIGEYTFSNCSKLESLSFPENLETIGNNAFSNCTELSQNLSFPASLKTIDKYAFFKCGKLQSADFSACTSLQTIGDCAFFYCTALQYVRFPENLETIGNHSFDSCEGLTGVSFTKNLETIGEWAFANCSGLQNVSFPESLRTIGIHAFELCSKLPDVNLPENLETIGAWAFSYCFGLKSVSFSVSLKTIGERAFYNCISLTSMTFPGEAPPSVGANAYNDMPKKGTLYRPAKAAGAYASGTFGSPELDSWVRKALKNNNNTGGYIGHTSPDYGYRTLTDTASGVRVSGLFTDSAELEVKETLLHARGDCPACDDIRERQKNGELIVLFDIALKYGQYAGDLDVEIPVGEQYNGQRAIMLHCNDKASESRTVTVSGGFARGTFSELSAYAVAKTSGGITGLPESYTLPMGQRVSWTPKPAGGEWSYDKGVLSMTRSGDTDTFKALKVGKATATYTVNGASFTVTITTSASVIPQTGDSGNTWLWTLLATAALLGCAALALNRSGEDPGTGCGMGRRKR